MSRLNDQNVALAREIIARYPKQKSALIPLVHLSQQQNGYVTHEAMRHVAELIDVTPAEVYGTASFYEMFRFEPTGKYLINMCGTMSCALMGANELMHHAEDRLGIKAGSTTPDGMFTLQHAECQAACTEAPTLQVNYRHRYRVTAEEFDQMIDDLASGKLDDEIPPHGTLGRNRQVIPADKAVGATHPDDVVGAPAWVTISEGDAVTAPYPYPWAAGYYDDGDRPQIVTSRFQYDDAHTIDRYLATGGYEGLRAALESSPEAVHDEVRKSTLLGRGGAGFPAGVKWGFTPAGVWPRYLVVNGDESEPGTYKDRLLMEVDPHQLIEGCLVACYAAGLSQCFLYVRGEMALAHERIASALNEAYGNGYIGKNILGTDFSVDIILHWGAGAYVVGEETALIESLEGERGMPRLKPPYFPAAIGLYGKPTIVNNVETLANLPFIAKNGSAAYTAIGTETSPGTRMIAVSGHVKRPGVYEIVNGSTTFRDLLYGEHFAQGIRDDNELKAFVPGGGSAPWFLPDQLDIPFEGREASNAGSMLGSGAVMVMDETTDIPAAALTLVKFYAHESCGKCVPCREGGTWLYRILERIVAGEGTDADLATILEVGETICPGDMPHAASERLGLEARPFPYKMTTICFVGPSAYVPVHSAMTLFPEDFEALVTKREVRQMIPVTAAPVVAGGAV